MGLFPKNCVHCSRFAFTGVVTCRLRKEKTAPAERDRSAGAVLSADE